MLAQLCEREAPRVVGELAASMWLSVERKCQGGAGIPRLRFVAWYASSR